MASLVTFDCYATLVDFTLRQATIDLLGERTRQHNFDLAAFFNDFRVMRFEACLLDYMTYDTMLRTTLRHAMTLHGLPYRKADGDAIVAAVPGFGPFPEVPAALERLKGKYEIGIISNSDDAILVHNVENIGVAFDHVVSAERLGAYKPKPEAFLKAWRIMGHEPEDVIHVAQGCEYDIMPTFPFGVERRVWINRSGLPGSDAFRPYDELRDLSGLPELLGV